MKDSDQYFWLENGEQRCDVPGFFRAKAMQSEIESRGLQIKHEYMLWLRTKRKEKENMKLLINNMNHTRGGDMTISEHMIDSIQLYVEHGVRPGGFLQAVLKNDLREAVMKADTYNQKSLPEIAGYLYNEIPALAWGDKDRFDSWIKRGGFEGIQAERDNQ